jgi:hypothetical protein
MAINLEEHTIIHSGIKFVPLSIAKQAVLDAYDECDEKLETAFNMIESSLTKINNTISQND